MYQKFYGKSRPKTRPRCLQSAISLVIQRHPSVMFPYRRLTHGCGRCMSSKHRPGGFLNPLWAVHLQQAPRGPELCPRTVLGHYIGIFHQSVSTPTLPWGPLNQALRYLRCSYQFPILVPVMQPGKQGKFTFFPESLCAQRFFQIYLPGLSRELFTLQECLYPPIARMPLR